MSKSSLGGYCSWCLKKVVISLSREGGITRKVYREACHCPSCNRRVVQCRSVGCDNCACWDTITFADKKIRQHDQFCGEHRGKVSNFSTLEDKLADPSQYEIIYKNRAINVAKVSTTGLYVVGGIAIMGPLAAYGAPALGGAIGSALGYSGAVATNVGLAMLGGGSIAAGGFGIAGGMTVMTVAGSAVGSGLGAYVGKSYLGDIDDFSIVKVRDGVKPAVITINGFLTQKKQSLSDWEEVLHKKYKHNTWYHVNWESQNLAKLGTYFIGKASQPVAWKVITSAARTARKVAKKELAPGAPVMAVISLATNPWHVAMVKAEKTGVLVADILRRCKGKEFTLLGHSLGARVIYCILRTLATSDEKRMVRDVHLFGGAVDKDRSYWRHAKNAVGGSIYNYYSSNDQVLKYMYRAGTFFASSPVGRHKIGRVKGVRNVDLSSIVGGHMKYKTRIVGEKLR